MPGYLIAGTVDYVVAEVDAEAARLLNTPVEAIRGSNLLALLDAHAAIEALRVPLRDAIVSHQACNAFVWLTTDAGVIERHIVLAPTTEANGESRLRMTIGDGDGQTTQTNDAPSIEAIVDVISHELRSPLNAMLVWATLLEVDRSPETTEKASAIIRDSVQTQARLIDDLIDVSRPRARPIDLSPLDLGELLVETLAEARQSLRPDIAVDIVAENRRHLVSGDPTRLGRVVRHLVQNAADAMPAGGKITLTLARTIDSITLSVADHGTGLSAEQIGNTFRPFWRPDRHSRGAGLGLGVVRAIIAQHNGSVCARSGGMAHGCTFTIALPACRD